MLFEYWLGGGSSLSELIGTHDVGTSVMWRAEVMFVQPDDTVDEYTLLPDGALSLTDMIDVIREKLSQHYGDLTKDCGFRLWRTE